MISKRYYISYVFFVLLSRFDMLSCHTMSAGYTGCRNFTFWLGTFHGLNDDNHQDLYMQGKLRVQLADPVSKTFLASPNYYSFTQLNFIGGKPAGLIDGSTNFHFDYDILGNVYDNLTQWKKYGDNSYASSSWMGTNITIVEAGYYFIRLEDFGIHLTQAWTPAAGFTYGLYIHMDPNSRSCLPEPPYKIALFNPIVTDSPTLNPTVQPTEIPTFAPTTFMPSYEPTSSMPSTSPTSAPSSFTVLPTIIPTLDPTVTPTVTPIVKFEPLFTDSPTMIPTFQPTATPTFGPTTLPSIEPTSRPTVSPTAEPSAVPIATPTVSPTAEPSRFPISILTSTPTVVPASVTFTAAPSARPSVTATEYVRTTGCCIR